MSSVIGRFQIKTLWPPGAEPRLEEEEEEEGRKKRAEATSITRAAGRRAGAAVVTQLFASPGRATPTTRPLSSPERRWRDTSCEAPNVYVNAASGMRTWRWNIRGMTTAGGETH